MKKIAIIGAGEFQNPLILKAKEMGFETHVFAWKEGAVGEETADFFYPISITEKEKILEQLRPLCPEAVVTVASDLANLTVQYLAKNLGLCHNSDRCLEVTTNKYAMRSALAEAGIPCPGFQRIQSGEEGKISLSYPVIVKPTDRSGSRGIQKLSSSEGLEDAVRQATAYSFEKKAIVEEFISGEEYSCECISFEGEHQVLAITKKFTTGAPCFIETGHLEPAPLSEEQIKMIKDTISAALTALEVRYGASHSEFRITPKGDVRIIEIGSRMGGDCIGTHLVPLSTGYDFLRAVIETACGKCPQRKTANSPGAAAIRFVFEKHDLEILDSIRRGHPEILALVSSMAPIGHHAIVDSGTRYGFYIVAGTDPEQILSLTELNHETEI